METLESLAMLAGGLIPVAAVVGVVVGHQLVNASSPEVEEREVVLPPPPPVWPRTREDVEKAVERYRASLREAVEKYKYAMQRAVAHYEAKIGPAVEHYRRSLLALLP
jgi:hypothetical protein